MKLPAYQIAVAAEDAAALLDISERSFHERRKNSSFPKPRQIGSRLRWIRSELEAWLIAQPPVDLLPEPPQLRASDKRVSIAPKPEAWPTAGHVTLPGAE